MNSSWYSKAKKLPTVTTTYRIGLLQAKAYRLLNVYTARLLEPHGIRPLDWALLGAVLDKPAGVSPAELAEELGVKAPHVSVMLRGLKKRGLLYDCVDEADRRQKFVSLTADGLKFIPKVEKELRSKMRVLVKDASVKDVFAYVQVLESIVKNGEVD